MNRQELVTYLNELERKYPLESWRYRGVDVWPILKNKLFFYYLNSFIEIEKGSTSTNNEFLFSKLSKCVRSIFSDLFLRFRSTRQVDILFSDAQGHYSKYQDGYVNRFYYPIEQYLKGHRAKDRISMQYASINYSYPDNFYRKSEMLFIDKIAYFRQILNQIKGKLYPSKINLDFESKKEFYEEIKGEFEGFCKSEFLLNSIIEKSIAEILLYKNIYLRILKIKPKMVFELCYYTPQHYGLNLACRELGIPTYEIMHGGMGNQHIAYSGWHFKIPKTGYNVLPQYIWLWDEPSYELVHYWMSRQQFHSCFIGGFPWLDFVMRKSNHYSEFFERKKKIIVYTLQFEFIEEYIYETISSTEESYEWWLRFHPRKGYAKENIITELKRRDLLHKVNLTEANQLPLPVILKNCWIHISEFSGSIIEASLLGKRTVILSETGAQAYYQYIENGLCVLMSTKNSKLLLDYIIFEKPEQAKPWSKKIEKLDFQTIFKPVF